MSKLVTAHCDWIQGHLRYGHWELELSDDSVEFFENMPEHEKEEFIMDNGHLIVDDYEIDFYERPSNIRIINNE